MSTPSQYFSNGKALLRMRSSCYLLLIMLATIWNNSVVYGAPAKLDELVATPFKLDLQPPPIFGAATASGDDVKKTIDSYGNPIESLKPIETPDGRKVVSAQGLQFEIPNYASGITELKKPSDDLLPPFVDKISSEEITSTDIQKQQQNPFLSGSYKPQPFSKANPTTTRRTTTSTTTTTTTTPAPKVIGNPFEATIPPWLKDFDYADVGPGVPFVYDPNDDESPVDPDILPPAKANAVVDTTKATFISSPTTATSFLNSQNSQQSFSTKFSSTDTSLTPSSSIPSKVTLPLPPIEIKPDDNSVTQQPLTVFVPPPPTPAEDINASKKTSSSFNTHFPARFEPSAGTTTDNTNKIPLSTDRESFPPFNLLPNSGSAVPTKTTFSKSEDGKVITNNIFLSGGTTQQATAPTKFFGTTAPSNIQQKDSFGIPGSGFTKVSTASTSFNQFTTSSGASGFVTASSSAASSGGTKYTGHFGGPPGVLAPNSSKPSSFVTASIPVVTQSFNKLSTTGSATPTAIFANKSGSKFTGSFGGPPGVLRPYDNIKSG